MNVITIKEHQTLSSKRKASNEIEQKSIDLLKTSHLNDDDRKLYDELENKGVLTMKRVLFGDGLQISTKSHIGVVQFSNFLVSVVPKFSNIKKIVDMIDYACGLDLKTFFESEIQFSGDKNVLSEIIISTFLNNVEDLIKKGIIKSYITHQDNIRYLRGKLVFQEQIINDAKIKLEFACRYDEFESDILENQILLYCLTKCYDLPINDINKKRIQKYIRLFENKITPRDITSDDFKQIAYNQMNHHYKKSHEICKLIINNIKISDFYKQKSKFINSFFVDMNVIFEKFVYKLFNQYHPLYSKEQQSSVAWKGKVPGGITSIVPDIILCSKDKHSPKIIIDTKYKKEITQADMYQIAFYIREFEMNKGYALLPKTKYSKPQDFKAINQNLEIGVRYIDVDKILDLINSKSRRDDEILKMLSVLVPTS